MTASLADPTDLYRYFDAEGQLLYVGISLSAVARAVQHKQTAAWWPLMANMQRETYPTRADAEQAERRAIRSERPIHNVVHNGSGKGKSKNKAPWACQTCGRDIGLRKEDGYIQVDQYDVFHVECKMCDSVPCPLYWIDAKRILTAEHLAEWTAHISQKAWADLGDWRYIVHEFCTIRNRDARVVEVIKMGAAKFYETTAK